MEFRPDDAAVFEMRRLIESFNRAAGSIREGRANLTLAYVEFVQSLASALDARDPYTAGHSNRVSDMSRALARAMELPAEVVERVRVGALLHDIGKIGIADAVLRKPGRLTAEEFAIVSEHPVIGRRILEGVHGFCPYLPAVELHHENWDGTGYPHGQSGKTTPVDARIIHVADAYDAMTTDRPYRNGMTHEEASRVLNANAGTQFDPEVVHRFNQLEDQQCGTGWAGPGAGGRSDMLKGLRIGVAAGLGLAFASAGWGQQTEAEAGFGLQGTFSAMAAASTRFGDAPRLGSLGDGGFRVMLYPTWKLSSHWTFYGALQAVSRPYYYSEFADPGTWRSGKHHAGVSELFAGLAGCVGAGQSGRVVVGVRVISAAL